MAASFEASCLDHKPYPRNRKHSRKFINLYAQRHQRPDAQSPDPLTQTQRPERRRERTGRETGRPALPRRVPPCAQRPLRPGPARPNWPPAAVPAPGAGGGIIYFLHPRRNRRAGGGGEDAHPTRTARATRHGLCTDRESKRDGKLKLLLHTPQPPLRYAPGPRTST